MNRQVKINKLHNFTSGQVVSRESSIRLLNYFKYSKEQYLVFRNERLVNKSKQLSDTISKVNLPKFEDKKHKTMTPNQLVKSTSKKIGEAEKQIEIARARCISFDEILLYGTLEESTLFDDVNQTEAS